MVLFLIPLFILAFVCLALISTAGGFIFETKTNTSMPLAYISKMEMLSGVVLLAILGICCVYDMFEEEQEEIINRLKR